MRKKVQVFSFCCLALLLFLTGCGTKQGGDAEKTEVEFTVVNPDDIPEELAEIIEENKQGEIKLTYEDQGYTYLVRGYGQQKTGGYSISVNEVYLSGDGLHVDTSLIGPPKDQEIRDEASYPYLTLKIEAQEAEIFFD